MRKYGVDKRSLRGFAFGLLILAAACSGDSPAGPGDPGTPNGAMSAKIDGAQWTANVGIYATRASGAIGLAGGNGEYLISMGVVGAVGTYVVGDGSGANLSLLTNDNQQVWMAMTGKGSGTITVTTLTDERVVGTFSFTAPAVASTSASGTRVITEGSFNIEF